MLELTINLSRVDSNTFTTGNHLPESALTLYARVDFIPQSETLDLASGACTMARGLSVCLIALPVPHTLSTGACKMARGLSVCLIPLPCTSHPEYRSLQDG